MFSSFHGLSSTPPRLCVNDVHAAVPANKGTVGTCQLGEISGHHNTSSSRSQFRVHQELIGQNRLCGGAGVRVGALAQGAPGGAVQSAPKPWVSGSHGHDNGRSRVRKRAYIRAMKRLRRSGQVQYRGQVFYETGNLDVNVQERSMDAVLDGRSRFFTWNCSGLSQEVFAEVLTWAADVGASCFALQETHWGFTADWRSDGWLFIHSAAGKPKTGGVLRAIRADLVTANSVRWAELVPGRLLHVRCLHGKQMMDFLTLYQQVKIRGDAAATKENLAQRDKTWMQLEKTLAAIPWRSYIVLAGDFNTSFSFSAPLIGKSTVNHESLDAYKRESERVSAMLKAKGLVALNTFGKRRMTYVHPSGSSFIDFVMVRRPVADLPSRKACAIRSPMAGWRTAGHRPVLATLRLDWRPWQRQELAASAH